MNTYKLGLLLFLKKCVLYYLWMITGMKNVNNSQILKVQPQDVA